VTHLTNVANNSSAVKETLTVHVQNTILKFTHASNLINTTYKDTLHIYTDASKNKHDRHVASAFYVNNYEFGSAERIRDEASVFEASYTRSN
jgi:hypothetical protein